MSTGLADPPAVRAAPFDGKSPIDGLLGCQGCGRLGVLMTRNDHTGDRGRPFPNVSANTLHEGIFDLSVLYRHGAKAICALTTGGRVGLSIYNPPATSITAANAIANIAAAKSWTSFMVSADRSNRREGKFDLSDYVPRPHDNGQCLSAELGWLDIQRRRDPRSVRVMPEGAICPPVHKLTETHATDITPYRWVHPDPER